MSSIKVGAGKTVISYTDEMFPNFRENYTGVHDDSYVQAVVLEQDGLYAVVTVGTVIVSEPDLIVSRIEQATQIPAENIILSAKHVLSAPHANRNESAEKMREMMKRSGKDLSDEEGAAYVTRNAMMCDAILEACVTAAQEAREALQPAVMRFGIGNTDVNINRLVRTNKGWWQGHNPDIPADSSLPVLRFDDMTGHPIAVLFGCNVAPGVLENSFLADGSRPASGDMAAGAERRIDAQYGAGTVSGYLIGASGDHWQALRALHDEIDINGNQTVTDLHEAGFIFVDIIASRLSEAVIKASESSGEQSTEGGIRMQRFEFSYPGQKVKGGSMREPSMSVEYITEPERSLGAAILAIGDTAILAVGVELGSRTWKRIKEESPFANTMLVEFSNVAGGGYMMEQDYFDMVTYQSVKCRYAAGGAEKLADDVIKALNTVKNR